MENSGPASKFPEQESREAKWGRPLWFRRAVIGVGLPCSTVRHFRAASRRVPEAGRAVGADGAGRPVFRLRDKVYPAPFNPPLHLRPRPLPTTPSSPILHWWANLRSVGAIDTAIAFFRAQNNATAFTVVEELACIRRHRFRLLVVTFWAGDGGLQLHG
jgi:hypothetical protein